MYFWKHYVAPEDAVWKAYDTHGLPIDTIIEVAGDLGYEINITDFALRLRQQQERSKEASKRKQEKVKSIAKYTVPKPTNLSLADQQQLYTEYKKIKPYISAAKECQRLLKDKN